MSMRCSLGVVFAVLSLSCATTGPAAGPFVATGGFDYRGTSASFSADRVLGSTFDISSRSDGSWAGRVGDDIVDLSMRFGALRGAQTTLSWTETPTGVTIDGMFYGQLMHFDLNDKVINVKSGTGITNGGTPRSFELRRIDRDHFEGGFGVRGIAADVHPPEPQLALALAAAFYVHQNMGMGGPDQQDARGNSQRSH
jgi:hypothetical protein